jgi:ectoine hydroxylase-related dioxygenase (phytanoyl-CoA dioxygenase family)
MTKLLSDADLLAYQRNGILFPVRVVEADEATALRTKLEAMEAREGGKLSPRTNQKPHLLAPWINELIRHPRILDAVEDILGPDLLCWSSGFFAKNAHDPRFVSWHQDGTYWGLSSPDVVTAWVAFTPSNRENGCMRVVPGTHNKQVQHVDTFDDKNFLSRGQELAVEVDEADAVDVVLKQGEMSLHNVLLFHGSEPNTSDQRRIGLSIRYIPTHVRQLGGPRDSATLGRGADTVGNFDLEPAPKGDFDSEAVAVHHAVVQRQWDILYAGAQHAGKRAAAKVRAA